jgi:hypothetical protein
MVSRVVQRREPRVRIWLAVIIMAGCTKGMDATRESTAPPAPSTPANARLPVQPKESGPQAPPLASPEPVEAAPPASPNDPRFTLLVSNQSSSVPQVDIQVRIDGRRVVDDTFVLGSGHTVKRYEFQLSKGAHQLRATAHGGAATYEGSIDMQAELWGALFFWRSPKVGASATEQQPAFSFEVQNTPIRLR